MNVTLGVPRIKEIINAARAISTPVMEVGAGGVGWGGGGEGGWVGRCVWGGKGGWVVGWAGWVGGCVWLCVRALLDTPSPADTRAHALAQVALAPHMCNESSARFVKALIERTTLGQVASAVEAVLTTAQAHVMVKCVGWRGGWAGACGARA